MAQPEYVPTWPAEQARVTERLPVPESWLPNRPAEVVQHGAQPSGPSFGSMGPDQGYALKLAHLFDDRLVLAPGEHRVDASSGCVGVATKRASVFGRAPVVFDLEVAFTLWGLLAEPPPELVSYRKPMFAECAHHYEQQRAIADQVPEATLRLSPADVKTRFAAGEWKALLGIG